MAADYTGNPVRMDTDADAISNIWVQQILWVGTEAAPFTAQDQLTLTINGTTCNYRHDVVTADPGSPACTLSIGPFASPVWVDTLTVTLIEGGAVEVWLALHPPRQSAP
jgi:hypothetical protein